mgnify:FL=1
MLEKDIEQSLVKHIKAKGGLCIKLNSSTMAGLPDRLVILKNKIIFIELKAPKQKPRKLQTIVMDRLKSLGCDVRVVDNLEDIKNI